MPCKPLRRAGRSMSHTCVSGKKNNYDDYYAHADGHGANYDDHDDNEDDNWKVKGLFTYSPSGSIDRSSESM